MQPTKPNIILLMVDDMGFSDVGCFGGEIETPNLDRLGRDGVRFTQFYNGARCCPTRASLLTGLYAHQAGVGGMVNRGTTPAYQGFLNDRCVTIAEALKPAGYRTLMSGKWHVGGSYDMQNPGQWRRQAGDPGHPIPVQRGFDEHYGILTGACSYWNPATLIHNDRFVEPQGEGYYLTDALTDQACRMIRGAAQDQQPFFLYWAPTTPHWPLHAHPHDIDKYRRRYDDGWDQMRKQRYARQIDEGVIRQEWNLSPRDNEAPPWNDVEDKLWESMRMAVYAAMMDNLDQNVGKVIGLLERLGIADDTMFVFLSDNGACAEFLREDAEEHEWPGHFALPTADGQSTVSVGNQRGVEPGPDGTFMNYDLPWANASNTPFRKFKAWTHEGGIATPLIVHWANGMKGGRVCHNVGHVIDLMPTILDAAGATYPAQYIDRDVLSVEGESLFDVIAGQDDWQRDRSLYWEHNDHKAARNADWKIVQTRDSEAWQLYNLAADRTELNDLSDEQPDVLRHMITNWQAWARRVGV